MRSSFPDSNAEQREASENAEIGHGGSFEKYMAHKTKKLRTQFKTEELARFNLTPSRSILFHDICIFVDGYTRPSHQELKLQMAQHGGRFETYFSHPPVTHFICEGLPLAKIKQMKRERNPVPVVHPDWIVESIKEGKVLPLKDFLLKQMDGGYGDGIEKFLDSEETLRKKARVEDALKDDLYPAENEDFEMHIHHTNKDLSPAEFIKSYFENSRLHFIGTWRLRIENLILEMKKNNKKKRHVTQWLNCAERIILHIDMDCFFASVATIDHLELRDVPLVVCHSSKKDGTAEISCPNYSARSLGIKAGQFIASAMEKCPTLKVVSYQFHQYVTILKKVYGILLKYCDLVEPVSCDECFVDVTDVAANCEELAAAIRHDIWNATKCTASIGIGPNKLLAKLATMKAKPDGMFKIDASNITEFLKHMDVKSLPGIGWALCSRLEEMGICTVQDILSLSKDQLEEEFGAKKGQMIWDYSHGIDNSKVEALKERKSLSAECNWGIRLISKEHALEHLLAILDEILDRMSCIKVQTRCITLKIRTREENAPPPRKYMGCGSSFDKSRSHTLDLCTKDKDVMMHCVEKLFEEMNPLVHDIRGLGITVSKLESEKCERLQMHPRLDDFCAVSSSSAFMLDRISPMKRKDLKRENRQKVKRVRTGKLRKASGGQTCPIRVPRDDIQVLKDVDQEVLAALPEDLRQEILQTLPLSHESFIIPGDNKDRINEDASEDVKPSIPSSNQNKSVQELLSSQEYDRVALKLENTLEEAFESVDKSTDASFCIGGSLLNDIGQWIKTVGRDELSTVSSILKVIRRTGLWHPVLFGHQSQAFVSEVKNWLHEQCGFWLKINGLSEH